MTSWIDLQTRTKNLNKAKDRDQFFLIQHTKNTLDGRLSFLSPSSYTIDVLTLHASENFQKALETIYYTLLPGGLFLGAFFGDKTLWELKETFLTVEEKMFGRITPRFLPLFSPQALIQAFQAQGFKDLVLDQECLVQSYKTLKDCYQDLKTMGETNCLSSRKEGLTSFRFFDQCEALYSQRFKNAQGYLPVTVEIIYVAAWHL